MDTNTAASQAIIDNSDQISNSYGISNTTYRLPDIPRSRWSDNDQKDDNYLPNILPTFNIHIQNREVHMYQNFNFYINGPNSTETHAKQYEKRQTKIKTGNNNTVINPK